VDGEMPTVDPSVAAREYEYVFMAFFDKTQLQQDAQAIWDFHIVSG
jgi:hypothetical protein